MGVPPNPYQTKSLLSELASWLRRYADKHAQLAELDRCSKDDLQRIAADAGVSESELRALAGKRRDAAELLYRRMAILRLDPEDLAQAEPAVLRDLQRLCSMCDSRKRCVLDLAKGPVDANWEDYCPNAMTLCALVAAQPEPAELEAMIAYLNAVGTLPATSDAEAHSGPENGGAAIKEVKQET
jgi:hypothetical protein